MDWIASLFTNDFMPHGHCYYWQPDILWVHVISDAAVFISYLLIPLALIYIIKKREDLQFEGIFWLFGAFILLCGATHLFEIVSVWFPIYRFTGLLKAATGIVSLFTAYYLFKVVPLILAIPSRHELEEANAALEHKTKLLKGTNRYKTEFLANTSHELRTPLNSIMVLSKVLEKTGTAT